ncbi:MAG: energy-coupling factor transporter transmembrane protein EcfT, partial [Chloroflexota bacterium]|nr:energy-coupling factor transporter transmembrane protein EcfT [Chloroflexota bacterium]
MQHATAPTFHPLAWLAWLGATLALLITTRNPLYLVVLLLCIGLVQSTLPGEEDQRWMAPISPWHFAALVVPLSALFNALSIHVGETVLVYLPAAIPVLGGPITLEALVFGALNGLVLSGIFAAFLLLNQALPMRSLVRLIPHAFHAVAVVVTIALSFVPTTMRQFQQIREAQAVRGHRVRGVRDWLPLLMPLLIGGLERAFQLAEAMTARGFASTDKPISSSERTIVVLGLVLLLG